MSHPKDVYREVRVEGYITDACLINPKARRNGDEPLYSVNIQPLDQTLFTEIELCEESIRRMTESPFVNPDNTQNETEQQSKIVFESTIRIESKFPPRLYGELQSYLDESEFVYKHVNAVRN